MRTGWLVYYSPRTRYTNSVTRVPVRCRRNVLISCTEVQQFITVCPGNSSLLNHLTLFEDELTQLIGYVAPVYSAIRMDLKVEADADSAV